MSYIGVPPFGQTIRSVTNHTATSGQTTFTISGGYVVGYVDVYLNGVLLSPSDYTATNGTDVVLASGATLNDEFQALAYQPVSLVDTYRKTEVDTLIANIDALPTQTGNSGKYLTTDGTDASWVTVTAPTPTAVSDQANTSTGYFDLPAGTTAQRPASPATGMTRFNTTDSILEYYDGSIWRSPADAPYDIEYLIVGGGSSGGCSYNTSFGSGGGGAGGAIDSSTTVSPLTEYPIVVGAGGAGAIGGFGGRGGGTNSTGFNKTALAGGGGGYVNWYTGYYYNGGSGGSGGGGGGYTNMGTGGDGTVGQGNAGGSYSGTTTYYPGAGGGGAGSAGADVSGTQTNGGNGGSGIDWKSLGTYYAAGGGGGAGGSGGLGGTGGSSIGGNGGSYASIVGTNAVVNTGSGGGGSADPQGTGGQSGSGSSGIVIVRYAGPQRGTGGTVTSSGGYTYHTFTSSGTYTA